VGAGDRVLVVGAGPVGLTVLAVLRQRGVEHVVVAEPVAERRALAERLGAAAVVDPKETPVFDAVRALPGAAQVVVFEAVGVPGVMADLVRDAPARTRLVVVGVCMEPDTIQPFFAVTKELDVRYSFAYGPDEMAEALRLLADGDVVLDGMVTGTVALGDVGAAFAALAAGGGQTKILVTPG
jgi:threonine dehydrogenase-like Zn-dependent dehydrogenase